MSKGRISFEKAVAKFRAWAASTPAQFGEWECDYDDWFVIWASFREFLQALKPGQWDQSTTGLALYILARDNEMEALKNNLIEHPKHLLALAKAGLHSTEQDARWQLADALGTVQADEDDILSTLIAYAAD